MSYGSQSLPASPRLGYANHPLRKEYLAFRECIARCTNPDDKDYPRYGGRGIGVDPSFLERGEGFKRFLACVGPAPSPQHTLDRIDNSRGYEPGCAGTPANLRWATRKEQAVNRDNTLWLCLDAEAAPLVQWAIDTDIPSRVLRDRLRAGWTDEQALVTPYTPRPRRKAASA
jgi:hypothetical protein